MLKEALKQGPIWALGTMSGTALDGVDAAMVLTDGADVFGFGQSKYRAYTDDERSVLSAALGQWEGLEAAAQVVEGAHAEVLSGIVGADVIGFHGQTTAHDPSVGRTCQIGDGRLLAHVLDTPIVWDFRSADVAMGGQGAPLAPFFHHSALRFAGVTEPSVVLNLGGVGNLTFVDPAVQDPAQTGACLAFDTGPANAPLNDLMQQRHGVAFDKDGALAAEGTPDQKILDQLTAQAFFLKIPPKSLDRDDFAWLGAAVDDLSDADAAATLTAAVAVSVAYGLKHLPSQPGKLLVTGGGRRNATMMNAIAHYANLPTVPVEDIGLDGDMLEAQAFAYLAVRTLRGWPTSGPGTTGVPAAVGGGVISYPDDILSG